MIKVKLENGLTVYFEDGHSWNCKGYDGECFVYILDIHGFILESYALDDVAHVEDLS